jgi:hypothetical protein
MQGLNSFKAHAPRVLPSIKACFDFCLSFPHDTQKNKKLRGHFLKRGMPAKTNSKGNIYTE